MKRIWPALLTLALLVASGGQGEPGIRFPKPDPDRAHADLKIFGPDGSPVRRPVEDWAGARRRVTGEPAWRDWLAAQRGAVNDWMARRQDRVEWVTGWWHDFVSPRDGSFLTWTADEPGEATLSSASDPRVTLTPKLHAAWVFGFRTRHAGKLVEAAQLFRLTSERPYAEWVASQLDFYATHYTRWPEKPGRGCRLMWQSLDEAVNYELFLGDTDLSHDPGTVGYGSPLHREYFTHGLAHNVPLIAGLGQAPWNPGELLAFDAENGRMAARQETYRPGSAATRELRIEDGKVVDTARLKLEPGARPTALGLALHLQGRARLSEGFAPDDGFATTNRPAAFRHWTECRTAVFTNHATFPVTFGPRSLAITLATPGRFTVTHAVSPDVPPRSRESFYLETTGTEAEFITTFTPLAD